MQEDLTLIEQVRKGEQEAYSELVNKYKNRLYIFLLRMLDQAQDAHDLTQEVFIKAYYQLNTFNGTSQFSTWLYRIAYNRAIDELRRRKPVHVPLYDMEFTDDESPEDICLAKERATFLHKQVMTLPENYRTVLLLRHTQELSYKQIGEVLDIPPDTVQVRLYRARKKLREIIAASEEGGSLHEMLDV
ncbi:RNA polymerase sigma factor [Bacillus chungangensis]|jgi:RNA polymerase sigma factor (sigma-70 family)|uniref:RNA polymerase sigma-70 factor (ECF subfamily) n=1 Tax=Bacillus chungangensis TaxID=587633 RepID=A0ABT9WZE8_9BACI|nr:sigma-70 family RNA polymerase sigma factor [Bacillus chungangensis]MDQ0178155.1 RNA polymerase sigma-70 factor (ECF subfamily) [Bacillus chungangensis]